MKDLAAALAVLFERMATFFGGYWVRGKIEQLNDAEADIEIHKKLEKSRKMYAGLSHEQRLAILRKRAKK